MKKLNCVFWLICVLTACNSETEEIKDEFLSDTVWKWKSIELTPDSSITESWFDNFSNMLELFPDIKYSLGEISEIQEEDTLFHQGKYKTAYLNFGKSICSYEDECYQEATIKQYNLRFQQYIFDAGKYNNDYIGTLEVTKDGIYLNYRFGYEEKIYTLDNFQYNRYIGKILSGEKDEKVYFFKNEIPLNFQRTNEQVIFTNDSLKWIGVIDLSQYSMEVNQIHPSKKFIHTFKLQ